MMKFLKYYLFLVALVLLSCEPGLGPKNGDRAALPDTMKSTSADTDSDTMIEENIEPERPAYDPDSALTAEGLNQYLSQPYQYKVAEKRADLNRDGIIDRIVVLAPENEKDEQLQTNPPKRNLYIFSGTADGRFKLMALNGNAVPSFFCPVIGSPETALTLAAGPGSLSYAYTNDTHFSYSFDFVYDSNKERLVLHRVRVPYLIDQRGIEVAKDLLLTRKDFGVVTLNDFNYYDFNVYDYLKK